MSRKDVRSPNRSRTRYLILGLLREGPLSGYDIARITKLRFRFFWSESYGQIYPELGRLARDGLATELPASEPRGRRSWAITEAGSRALETWLEEPEAADSARLETVLKAYFAAASPGSLAKILGGFRARLAEDLATLERMEAELRSIPDPHRNHQHALMTAELGLVTYRAWMDWAERWSKKTSVWLRAGGSAQSA
jgi:PadR family transcriptional regulator, regulatory protein AphA